MISLRSLSRISIVMAVVIAGPAFGQAVREPPSRIGNVWDGRAHEPDPSSVDSSLKALGYAPKPQTERIETDEVEGLYQQLMRDEDTHGQQTASRGPRTAAARQPGRSSLQ
jgi:hypothetical protein